MMKKVAKSKKYQQQIFGAAGGNQGQR